MSLADDLRELLLKDERWERVYNKINGEYQLDLCDDVKDECERDGVLGPLIQQIGQARNRIAERLGVDPVLDPDFDEMTGAMEKFSRACGKLMYHYGYLDGEKAE